MSDEILNNYVEEDEIDFRELFFVLRRKWWLLITCAIAGAAIALAYTLFLIQPIYTSSSMIYIFSKSTTITSAIDLQIGEQLTVDFEILGKSRPVIEKVISDLELDTTYEDLLETVTVENPKDSRIIKITIENTDPQLACDIANCLADNLAARVAEVIDTDKPSSVESAVPAIIPSSPSKSKNTALGGILGLLLAAAIVLIQYYSDMSIKDEDDVRKYLGMSTLASIPFEKSICAERDGKKSKGHKKRRK
ncbi:YveK family protein [Butyrivibrio sp. MB2005]|uniref:YveK family protein n=1 Tax=Butyrivibrio sp. MB2005 TaxID=1280678 RepID=UPI0004131087|nr:Wzz/FepE/Etk N-terminal domain-containing protein [Butyrivibrio sp. MB2005]